MSSRLTELAPVTSQLETRVIDNSENGVVLPPIIENIGAVAVEAQLTEITNLTSELRSDKTIEARTKEALNVCDFETTPEEAEKIKEFYGDNYLLAADILTILEDNTGNLVEKDNANRKLALQEVIDTKKQDSSYFERSYQAAVEYLNMPPAISNLIRPYLAKVHLDRLDKPDDPILKRAELMLLVQATEALFAESSVGVTTIGDREKSMVSAIASEVLGRIDESGFVEGNTILNLKSPRSFYRPYLENPTYSIDNAEQVFWKDCRYGGQLLFHNSPNMAQIRSAGALMPRRMQENTTGTVFANTGDTADPYIHSPMVHWSEDFDSSTYKHGIESGTIAMPLWKIIETAPFARDSEYATLRVKPDRLKTVTEKIRIIDGVSSFGVGNSDSQGGESRDRTFYSSPHDVLSTAPIKSAPDGHQFNLDSSSYMIALGSKETEMVKQYGVGEGLPRLYEIEAPDTNTSSQYLSAEERKAFYLEQDQIRRERQEQAVLAIAELQRESIDENPDIIVASIRSHVFDFYVPDDGDNPGRMRAQFAKTR